MKINDRLSTLTQSEQLRVIERVFQKLFLAFGNQMQAKWQGLDMQAVYLDWAESLQGCSLGSINHAINLSKMEEHPPSQGKFMELCKTYKPELIELKLDKPVVKQADGFERVQAIKNMLARKWTA